MSALHHPQQIFERLANAHFDSEYALIILTSVSGGTLRARGAIMAVTKQGVKLGYISQGCVDEDIIAHSLYALEKNVTAKIIYGDGSPFKDIRLPCAGRIELTIIPRPDQNLIFSIHDSLNDRKAVDLYLDEMGCLSLSDGERSERFHYAPPLRLLVAGRGEAMESLCMQAETVGMKVCAYSPYPEELDVEAVALTTPDRAPDLGSDKWSAAVLLFHAHDWEAAMLDQLLKSEAFYIGAMGSLRTHAARVESLKIMGWGETDITRIHAPIGHIPGLRDGGWLGASILADIARAARNKGLL